MASVAHWLIDIMLQLLSCFCIYQGLCEFIASCSKLMIRMVCLDWLTYLTIVVSRCFCEVRANWWIYFQLWAPGSLGFTSTCIVIFDLYNLLILCWRGGWCLVCVGRWCWFWRARWYWISKWLQLLSTCTDGNRYDMFGCVARVALWLFQRSSIGLWFYTASHCVQPQYVPHALDYQARSCYTFKLCGHDCARLGLTCLK